jgi:transposase
MHRHALTEAQWARLVPLLPHQKTGPKALRGDRLFVEAVIFRAKTGIHWRDLVVYRNSDDGPITPLPDDRS